MDDGGSTDRGCGRRQWRRKGTSSTVGTMAEGRKMKELDHIELQRRYGGQYVAGRGGEVLVNARTYKELEDELDKRSESRDELVIQYVTPADVIVIF
jgi:hypothetical protein